MKKESKMIRAICLFAALFVFNAVLLLPATAQQATPEEEGSQVIEPDRSVTGSEFVTINVRNANIAEVLKAYSLQTGQSIVVGPDVVSDNVNVRLNNIPWEEALDVILKPYGFGYRVVGDTIVISKLESIVTVEGIEPLVSKVFKLKYLDAYDIKEICEAQLTTRGKFTILSTKALPGWEFGSAGSSSSSGATGDAGIRKRKKKEDILKSKVLVITDVPSAVTKIEKIIEEMDTIPEQVLIEAKFLEIKTDKGSKIGLDYLQAMENVEELTTVSGASGGTLEPTPLSTVNRVLNMSSGFPDPLMTGAAGSLSQQDGLRLSSIEIDGQGYDMLFSLIAQDDNADVLSAPKLLTLNNQEAAMLIGTKYPIIESSTTAGGSGGAGSTATSLDYYESIGIQLNVIPQICDEGLINMIVHPAVSEIEGFQAGIVFSGGTQTSGTQYPILRIREAETQVMIKSGNTAVIGGLQQERDSEVIQKIPFIGDIPFIGRLFRNETLRKEKVDLLIFIKGSIVGREDYAAESVQKGIDMESSMRIKQNEEVEPVAETNVEPVTEETISKTDSEEILKLVDQITSAEEEGASDAAE